MHIGEVAGRLKVKPDTIRFYERAGALPRPARGENGYREYTAADIERLRLVIELRRLDLPLEGASQLAGWCSSGHCNETTESLPDVIATHRAEVERRIESLTELASRLRTLERHLRPTARALPVLGQAGPCCAAAGAVVGGVLPES
jgi:DNA-binding transcriptional MerR regulator